MDYLSLKIKDGKYEYNYNDGGLCGIGFKSTYEELKEEVEQHLREVDELGNYDEVDREKVKEGWRKVLELEEDTEVIGWFSGEEKSLSECLHYLADHLEELSEEAKEELLQYL